MTSYRVIDLRADANPAAEIIIEDAHSPEDAARKALGRELVRSGRRSDVRARVYFQHPGQPISMVRLYDKAEDRTLEPPAR
jgi:hypothetical protein